MRCYRLSGPGSLDRLTLTEEPIRAPGPGEVRVRIRASAFNFRDYLFLEGRYAVPVAPDLIPLSDAAGEVVAVGPDARRFRIGDQVMNSIYKTRFGETL